MTRADLLPRAAPVGLSADASDPAPASPLHGARRLARVAGLGGSSLVLACGAHLLGGGRLPSVAVLAVVTLLLGLVATTLTARRCRLPLLLAVLGVEQVALHWTLAWATAPSPTTAGCLPGSGHHALAAAGTGCVPAGAAPDMSGMVAFSGVGLLMWVAHVVAVLLTALVLARGEAWLWRVADRIVAVAHARLGLHQRRRPARSLTRTRATGPTRRPDPCAAPRGPPRAAAAAC